MPESTDAPMPTEAEPGQAVLLVDDEDTALEALAERLRERLAEGLRVLLVSCGAEEVMQGGIRAFMDRHRGAGRPRDERPPRCPRARR